MKLSFFFFKQKTAYEIKECDWSSDVCSSDLKHDSPFFKKLLDPFKWLGEVLADAGYLSRENYQFVIDRNGSAFIPFKKNSTAKPKSYPAWKFAFNLWKVLPMIFKGIYNQRSKVEMVFSVLKRRYGDHLYNRGAYRRRREFALRLIDRKSVV